MNHSERTIQYHLYLFLNADVILPNTILYGLREMDLMAIMNSGYIYEYEIKTSRSDYSRDFREKRFKHRVMNGLYNGEESDWKRHVANRFWFATPPGLARDVPDYAGLVEVEMQNSNKVQIIKKAPLLHREKITQKQLMKACKRLMYPYWQNRIKEMYKEAL